jgi:hypothetical protein
VYLKAWGPIWGSNIKNVWLTCKRIRSTSGLFFSVLSWFFLIFCFHFHFVHLGRVENAFSLTTILWDSIVNHVNSKIDQKWESWCALNLSNKDKRKQWKRQKWKNEQPWTLAYTLVLQTMCSLVLVQTNWFSLQNDAMQAKSKFDLSLSWTYV